MKSALFITIWINVCWLGSNILSGADNCPEGSSNLIRMCQPVTVTNENRYTIEFSDFELSNMESCSCSFIAPSRGEFKMFPTSFSLVNNCGTRVTRTVSNVLLAGGTVECRRDPFLPLEVYPGEQVAVKISITSFVTRIAPYCYVAIFPANVTFTCTGSMISSSTSQMPTTSSSSRIRSTSAPTSSQRFTTSNSSRIRSTSTSAPTSTLETSPRMTNVSSVLHVRTTTTTVVSMTSKGTDRQRTMDKTSKTDVTGYIIGLVLLSVVIFILLGVILFLLRKKHNERKNDKGAQIYEQCTSPRDIGYMQTYDELRPQPASNIYLNTVVDKEKPIIL